MQMKFGSRENQVRLANLLKTELRILIASVLVRVTIAMMNPDQKQVRGKRSLFGLHFHITALH